jgi:hypothetical protein
MLSTNRPTAGTGATFAFVRDASANLRRKDDVYNDFYGGFAAGAFMGLYRRWNR